MSDAAEPEEQTGKKGGRMPLVLGLVLAILGGAGGFYASWSGLAAGKVAETETAEMPLLKEMKQLAYVDVDPLVISLTGAAPLKHLTFRANLEVRETEKDAVKHVLPRVSDALNSYLRALDPADLEDPAALSRLRAQMLHRVQVIAGSGKVTDLLILEFVLT